jgi:poly-gamma-glutamate capsule biosynthesis protein CapA/YwtB (metallophosphatase superfamily)
VPVVGARLAVALSCGLLLAVGPAAAAPLELAAVGAAPQRPRPAARASFDIVASGDILIHGPVAAAAWRRDRYDFRPLFARIRPLVRGAALALCHVETPIGAGPRSGYPLFNAPAELADAIRWTGWDACSTASNHALDRGADGVAATLRSLARAGVRFTGTARSRREGRRILLLRPHGVTVAFLAYTYGTNGLPRPHPWSVNLIWRPRIVADARRARRRGADLVLVNLHWGSEYVRDPTPEQRRLARSLLRTGLIDAVLGQHAHVVQPIRRVFGRFVVYGEGNLLSAQSVACCSDATRDGLIVRLRVRAGAGRASVARVEYVPTRVLQPGFVIEPLARALRRLGASGEGASPLARELRTALRRTIAVVGRRPSIRPVTWWRRGRAAESDRRGPILTRD